MWDSERTHTNEQAALGSTVCCHDDIILHYASHLADPGFDPGGLTWVSALWQNALMTSSDALRAMLFSKR